MDTIKIDARDVNFWYGDKLYSVGNKRYKTCV